jgi:hypothetical protein
LFRGWFQLADRCPSCGWRFERKGDEGFAMGAMAVNFILSEGVFAALLVTAFIVTSPDPPVTLLTLGGIAVNVALAMVFYPFSKTIWAALELLLRPPTVEEQADAELAVSASRTGPSAPTLRSGAGGPSD